MRPWLPHPLPHGFLIRFLMASSSASSWLPHPLPHGFLIRFLIRVGLGFLIRSAVLVIIEQFSVIFDRCRDVDLACMAHRGRGDL
jgi:hypothetical protein